MSCPQCSGHLCVPAVSVLSHTSAAKLWTMPLPGDTPDVTHVTLPMSRSRWAATSATVHRRNLTPQDVVDRAGVRLTSPLRTLLDLPSVLSLGASVAAADAAMRAGLVSRTELRTICAQATGRGARGIRDLGRLADPSAESPLESEARVLLTLADMAPEATQYVLKDGKLFVARIEFAWPSRKAGLLTDGHEYHSQRDALRHDREPDNAFRRLGWTVPRVTWEHVYLEPTYLLEVARSLLQ